MFPPLRPCHGPSWRIRSGKVSKLRSLKMTCRLLSVLERTASYCITDAYQKRNEKGTIFWYGLLRSRPRTAARSIESATSNPVRNGGRKKERHMSTIDKQRIAGVRTLEALGY